MEASAILRPLGVQAAAIGTGAYTGIGAAALHPEEARLVAGGHLQGVVFTAFEFREGPRIGRGPQVVAVAVPVLAPARLDASADRIVVPFLRPYAGAPVHAERVPRVAVVRIAEAPAKIEDAVLIAAACAGIERSRFVLVFQPYEKGPLVRPMLQPCELVHPIVSKPVSNENSPVGST